MALMICALLLDSGCKPVTKRWEPSAKLPEGILDQEAMIALLVDIHLAEGDVLDRSLPAEDQAPVLQSHYAQILALHHISAQQLQESYQFYIERPITLNGMYDEVIEILNRMQANATSPAQTNGESKPRVGEAQSDSIPGNSSAPAAQNTDLVPGAVRHAVTHPNGGTGNH